MNENALARAATVEPSPRKGGAPQKNKNAQRLTAPLRRAIDALATGEAKTVPDASRIAGITERAIYAALHKPHVQAHLHATMKRDLRTLGVVRAAARYRALIDSESEYVAADISKDALAQAGVRDRIDGAQRQSGAGNISIVIHGRPGELVRIETQDVVHDGTAQRLEDEQTS